MDSNPRDSASRAMLAMSPGGTRRMTKPKPNFIRRPLVQERCRYLLQMVPADPQLQLHALLLAEVEVQVVLLHDTDSAVDLVSQPHHLSRGLVGEGLGHRHFPYGGGAAAP